MAGLRLLMAALALACAAAVCAKTRVLKKSCREEDDRCFREPPASTIGIPGLHGFVCVGKAGIGGGRGEVGVGQKDGGDEYIGNGR